MRRSAVALGAPNSWCATDWRWGSEGPARPLLHVQALALDLSNLGGALSEPACVSGESPHRK
jgi:hypothetical protein